MDKQTHLLPGISIDNLMKTSTFTYVTILAYAPLYVVSYRHRMTNHSVPISFLA